MKKKIVAVLTVFVLVMTIAPTIIFAANDGGTGTDSGNSSGELGGAAECLPDTYWQVGFEDGDGYKGIASAAAFRYDLVYKEQNGGREILKTVIVQIPSRAYNDIIWGQAGVDTTIATVKEYTNAVEKTNTAKYGVKYVTDGPLATLSNRLLNGETIDSIFGPGLDDDIPENKRLIESYLTSSQGFGVDKKDLQRKQDENPGRYESFGYRIMIQKIQIFQNGCVGASDWWKAMTRKDAASNNAIKKYLVGDRTAYISPNVTKAGNDLFTTRDDMGVRNAIWEKNYFANAWKGLIVRDLAPQFADPNNGSGYNILWFSTDPFKDYDYSIDAACVNCLATGFSNKAYVIQDTTNWEAILASPDANVDNARKYYDKGNGVFCREEYYVNFPDLTNHIRVNTGRYFTVNATNKELATLTVTPPNFKPITVTRTRQCKSSTNNVNALNNFERNSRSTFKDNAGTVKLKYTEYNKEESKYSKKSIELVKDEFADNTYSSNVSNNMLTMTQTVSYTLKDDVYRYIRLQDGLSIYDPNGISAEKLKNEYRNVGIANLPISFENETTGQDKIADIQLSYELPTDPNSKIKEAYKMDNNYFTDPNNPIDENIYQKAIKAGAVSNNSIVKGSLDDEEYSEITQSACAKLYSNGSGGYHSGLYSCVANRTKNKIGNNNDCIVQNDLENSNSGYICPVTRDPNDGICRIEDGKYYLGDGSEVSKEEYYEVCPEDCRIENGKYYDFEGKEITKEEYDAICPPEPYCPEDECPYGCCPDGSCAPMPDGTCPGYGGKDVIYRTIDLENPFPGQGAEQRDTGSNWCNYNIKTQKIDCSFDNNTVKHFITRERGGTVNGGKVYRENHILYEVTLDSNTIASIRSYNDKNKYDDWTLKCEDNGRACISEFLRSEVQTSGVCSKVNGTNFYTCDKDV